MKNRPIDGTPNLRQALVMARQLGCDVRHEHGGGEILVTHPTWPRRVKLHHTRKDSSRILLVWLRMLEAAR